MTTAIAMQLNLFSGQPEPGSRSVVCLVDPTERPAPRQVSLRSVAARTRHADEHRGRKALILDCLRVAGRPLSDRQIKERIFGEVADMNTVRPRVSDLIASGDLAEVGEVEDHVTGEPVRTVWLAR